jgi:hypothetical protein
LCVTAKLSDRLLEWVIFDRSGRPCLAVHVRCAPKADSRFAPLIQGPKLGGFPIMKTHRDGLSLSPMLPNKPRGRAWLNDHRGPQRHTVNRGLFCHALNPDMRSIDEARMPRRERRSAAGSRCQFVPDAQNGTDPSFQVHAIRRTPRLAAKALLMAATLAASQSSSRRRPRLIPCSFARASPASTRSRIMARSNSAKTPII